MTNYTVIYGVYIQFWPTLHMLHASASSVCVRACSLGIWRVIVLLHPRCRSFAFIFCFICLRACMRACSLARNWTPGRSSMRCRSTANHLRSYAASSVCVRACSLARSRTPGRSGMRFRSIVNHLRSYPASSVCMRACNLGIWKVIVLLHPRCRSYAFIFCFVCLRACVRACSLARG